MMSPEGKPETREGTDAGAADFEDLLFELSELLVADTPDGPDEQVEHLLSRIAASLDIDRCVLWGITNTDFYRITHSWSKDGVAPVERDLRADSFPYLKARLLEHREPFKFSDPEELPDAAAIEKEYYAQEGIQSSLIIPLIRAGHVVGALSLASLGRRRSWDEDLVRRLTILGQFFVNLAERKRTEEVLRASEERYREMVELLPSMRPKAGYPGLARGGMSFPARSCELAT